jgi:hypothetical protein
MCYTCNLKAKSVSIDKDCNDQTTYFRQRHSWSDCSVDLWNMKFELECDTHIGHCWVLIDSNRLADHPLESQIFLCFWFFSKISDYTKILKHTTVFYHLLLNLTMYSNTWLHLLKHCLLIIWRIFTANFIFKDVVKKWNWWFFYRWRRPTVNKDSLPSQGNKILFIALLLFFAFVKAGENSLKHGQSFFNFCAYKWQLKGTYNY